MLCHVFYATLGLSGADTISGKDIVNDAEAMCQQGIVKEFPVAVQKGGVVLKQVRFFIPKFSCAEGQIFPGTDTSCLVRKFNGWKAKVSFLYLF